MDQTPKQQAVELITKAQNLLVVPGRPDGDSLGSALALLLVAQKLGKNVSAAVLDPMSEMYRFLPGINQLSAQINGLRDFVITLQNPSVEADRLSYNIQGDQLNIIITPKVGSYRPEDVSFNQGELNYDVIVVVDAADLSQLGEAYNRYPAIFQEIPVINIDHHASNAFFGAVNVVDLTATSTAEILVGLIEALGQNLIDEDVATCLLAGIISDTGSFQNFNTTPKSLTVAAQMVGHGARQQEIIRHLFKTKALSTLKLWGQVLARLNFDPTHKLVWSTADLSDLASTGATKEDFTGLIDSLMTSVPGADVVLLLTEREPGQVYGSIRTAKGVDAAELARLFGGGGHPGAAAFQMLDVALEQAKPMVIGKFTEYQAKRLGVGVVSQPEEVASEA
ncbi:MAG: DHH family phosphoesterase [bacterium]